MGAHRASVTSNNSAVAPSWHDELKSAIRDPIELCQRLELPDAYHEPARRASQLFPVFAPPHYLARIRPGDPHDPLLRQILPLADECREIPGFHADPLAEEQAALTPGLLQKYAGRALLVTTGACAVHCRYCFRRHFPYHQTPKSIAAWTPAIERLAEDASIEEVILSGGDPLMLTDRRLAELVSRLSEIDHLRRLRIHTRVPIMIPSRVCDELLSWLAGSRLAPIMVVHANHPQELDAAVLAAVQTLITAGVPVLNQAVLLRGVNDNLPALEELCRRLVNHRVMPYYLHQLDRVAGAAHFETPVDRGLDLVRQLRRRLPGYAVPRYVREVPGEAHKTLLI